MKRPPRIRALRLALSVALSAALAPALSAADPFIGYLYPSGLQAGTTNRLVIGGQGFWGKLDAGVTGGGVRVLKVTAMPQTAPPTSSQAKWLRKWLDGILTGRDRAMPPLPTNATARVGEWTSNAWWRALGTLSRRELEAVERDIYIRKNALQMTPSLRQHLFVDVAVDADAKPGRRTLAVWTTYGISTPYPLYVSSVPMREEPFYAPPHRTQPAAPAVTEYPVFLNGRIMPGESDRFTLTLAQGATLVCDVCARELQPFVGDAVPGFFNAVVRLTDDAGGEIAFADDRKRFLPDPYLRCTVPKTGTYTLEIRDNLFRGREDFVYRVFVTTNAASQARSAAGGAAAAPPGFWRFLSPRAWFGNRALEADESVRGVLRPGVKDVYDISLSGPGSYVFDLAARRDGSPLDGLITVRDERGEILARCDDVTNALFVGTVAQAECDACGRLTLTDAATRRLSVTVEDVTGHGGDDYAYTLSVKRERPGFAVYAERSTFLCRANARVPVTLRLERTGGFTGPVVLLEDASFRFENGYFPPGVSTVRAHIVSKERRERPLAAHRFRALAELGGRPVLTDVVPADIRMQAFAWHHLVPADAFVIKENLPPPAKRSDKKAPRR